MDNEWTTLEILRHSRHDWLNKIQLIKGNLELDRSDRARAIIEEIIIESQHEARLSNLKMPQFGELLMTANWQPCAFRCEFEVIDTIKGCSGLDETITAWTRELFTILNESLDGFSENVLSVSIFETNAKNIRFTFDLEGSRKDDESLKRLLSQPLDKLERVSSEFTETCVVLTLDMKI